MSEPVVGGVTYSPKEMFAQIREDILGLGKNIEFLTRQSDQERNVWEQRFVKLEGRLAAAEEQLARAGALEKVFLGFESRFGLHEAAAYHPSAQGQQASLVLDVESLKAERVTREKLDEYVKEVRQTNLEHEKDAVTSFRWRVGLGLTLGATTLLQLARALGWLGP
jgi:hypothetical protein